MRSHFRIVLGSLIGISIVMLLVLGFHVGGQSLAVIGTYSPLFGCLISISLLFVCVRVPIRREENVEPWLKRERLAWIVIGCGVIGWTVGESLWDYYTAHGQSPFPSLADIGYSTFSPLVFVGLILLPSSSKSQKYMSLILDSLIAMGALLSIAWFFLLGPLSQTPAESPLGKFLGLYYPTADAALLSCVIFLLLRGTDSAYRSPARRISLLILGIGLSLYSAGDFLFNVLSNEGTYVAGNWVDLSWPLGMMTMAMGVYLRRFLPRSTDGSILEEDAESGAKQFRFGPAQFLPYLLLIILFVVLGFNVLSSDKTQQNIRPVLLISTLIVVGLVIVRQVMTMQENETLMNKQVDTLKKLEKVYHEVENRKIELEAGIGHLKEVQTRLANGDVRARAQIMGGDLWPLATGLNLMADRMMRSEHNQRYAQKLVQAVGDLSLILESSRGSRVPVVLPPSCLDVPELHRLLAALGLRPPVGAASPPTPLSPTPFQRQTPISPAMPNNPFDPNQASTLYSSRRSL
jgi:hypothetical protein